MDASLPPDAPSPWPSRAPHTALWLLCVAASAGALFFLWHWIGWPQVLWLPVAWIPWGLDGLPAALLADFVIAYPFTWARRLRLRRWAWRLVAALEVAAVLAWAGWELWLLVLLPFAAWMAWAPATPATSVPSPEVPPTSV